MNLTISKDDLSCALQRVRGACGSRTLPILNCVLLRAVGDRLHITANNLDLQISHSAPCVVRAGVEVALPFAAFSRYVSEFPSSEIEIEIADNLKTTLKTGAKRASLSGFPAKEFVELKPEKRQSFTMAQADLKSALRRTLISVSTDDTRPVLNGILFQLKDGTLTIVSTQGTCLSRVVHEIEGDGIRATLPTKAATELARLLPDDGADLVSFGENTAEFTVGDAVLTSKLIAEVYPNFKQVIPNECVDRITVSREELLASVRFAASAEVDPNKCPKILAAFERNRLTLESAWQNSDARDSIAIQYTGKGLSIPLAPEQVENILRVLTDDEVQIQLIDNLSPLVITAGNFLGLTMPFRQ